MFMLSGSLRAWTSHDVSACLHLFSSGFLSDVLAMGFLRLPPTPLLK